MEIENRNIDELENRIRQAENGDMKAQYQLGMFIGRKSTSTIKKPSDGC